MALSDWVRLPSAWIDAGRLAELRWAGDGVGSDNTAALMTLAAIAHHADGATGISRLTYDALCGATGLNSRSKLSNGLDVLEGLNVIERTPEGRSSYKLRDFDPQGGWAKLPAKRLYAGGRIVAFDDFKLRSPAELNALKLYFLFAARRDRRTNMAKIGFDKIESYTGIDRHRIKAASSLLATLGLVYTERVPSKTNDIGVANAYRLMGLESYVHMGTRGRGIDAYEFEDE